MSEGPLVTQDIFRKLPTETLHVERQRVTEEIVYLLNKNNMINTALWERNAYYEEA